MEKVFKSYKMTLLQGTIWILKFFHYTGSQFYGFDANTTLPACLERLSSLHPSQNGNDSVVTALSRSD